jgi:hypothetical protein
VARDLPGDRRQRLRKLPHRNPLELIEDYAATEIRAHAEDFAQLIRDVPVPRVFSDLEQKIRVAEAANEHFNGMYAPVPYGATPGATGADDTIVGDPKPGSPDIHLVDNTLAPHPGQPVPHRRQAKRGNATRAGGRGSRMRCRTVPANRSSGISPRSRAAWPRPPPAGYGCHRGITHRRHRHQRHHPLRGPQLTDADMTTVVLRRWRLVSRWDAMRR